jgi:23S rRNA (cytidine2498-2'-O)-methyltransferase
MSGTGRVLFSVAEDSFSAAARELRDEFGPGLGIERAGPDLGMITSAAPGAAEVARACAARPLVFIRHLTVEVRRVPLAEAADIKAVVAAARSAVADGLAGTGLAGTGLAVQVWASGASGTGYGSGDLRAEVARALAGDGIPVARAGQRQVLSCCIAPAGVLIGLNRAGDSLSDWPGGRVRLSRDPAQVSRAEFKLEELFQAFPVRLPPPGRAVDLGASPGGWTRILRSRGMTVWAVDPAGLDPRVAADPLVHHARTTAGEFFRSGGTRFDLAVNDMRMDPELSCRVMLDAARQLRRGALAIVTLKVGTRRPAETARRCLRLLGGAYEIEHARQLHHNRHEVTVVARRRAAS